ncbi:MAG: hypothetical protein ACW976_07055, partial [Candidatus Ranarchaeia archaeon]
MVDVKLYEHTPDLIEVLADDFFKLESYKKPLPTFSKLTSTDTESLYKEISKTIKDTLLSPLADYWLHHKKSFLRAMRQYRFTVDDMWNPKENAPLLSTVLNIEGESAKINDTMNQLLSESTIREELLQFLLENVSAMYQEYFISWELPNTPGDITTSLEKFYAQKIFWVFVEAIGNHSDYGWTPTAFFERLLLNMTFVLKQIPSGTDSGYTYQLNRIMKWIAEETSVLLHLKGKSSGLFKDLLASSVLTAPMKNGIFFNFLADDV